ncbi:MAG: hypothetical protein H0W76_26155 [Pyrinomonadaceae bacterium]|nr:hypothetical protein [Pyrinomonadaceae bacterium]
MMGSFRLAGAALVLLGAVVFAIGQNKKTVRPEDQGGSQNSGPVPEAHRGAAAPITPSTEDSVAVKYRYEFEKPEFDVRSIIIEHDARGAGRIVFERKGDGEPLTEPLALSPAALERITGHWSALRFLETETNYQSDKQFAHLGTSRLKMSNGERERSAEFNWTKDRDASALVNEYRRVADQSLFVFEINVALEIQPLESPKLLTRLDSLLGRNAISDPQQLVPLLRSLSTDERLPLIARNHAVRLLKKIEK